MSAPISDCGWTPFRLKLFFRNLCSRHSPPSNLRGSLPSMIPDEDAPAHDLDIESVVNLFEILFANGTNSGSSYAPPRERLKEGLEALGIITTVLQRDAIFESFDGAKYDYNDADKENAFAAFKNWIECQFIR